ncbi:LysR family transcriptional regulator [Thalassovita aquimarina]|uniref:LysR family transcriptional regulator n=1 Tax=Thalassovita aquimarina TaxID=2785917 RepID=UPI00356B5E2D
MDWDDYRLLLSIARSRGLPGAASELGVSVSTVFRRLEKIEEERAQRLFTRARQDYVPTEIGIELVRVAESIETEVQRGERAISGRDQQLTGTLRVTASEVIANYFLARHIPDFRTRHPQLSMEILSGNSIFSLEDQTADIALRPVRPTDVNLVGRKVAELHWGRYCSASPQGAAEGRESDREPEEIIGYSSGPISIQEKLLGRATSKHSEVFWRSNSLVTNAAIAQASRSTALLPCILGESWPGLRCVEAPIPEVAGELWIVCHKDMHRTARIRAFFDFVIETARSDPFLRLPDDGSRPG